MQTRTAAKDSRRRILGADVLFGTGAVLAPSFFSESPFTGVSPAAPEAAHAEPHAAPTVQRKCTACEADTRILPQLEVGPVDDPLETEADVMADHVVRRQAADMDDDERQAKPLQTKAKDPASSQSAFAPATQAGGSFASASRRPAQVRCL